MSNKDFQVRHGLVVNSNLIVANSITGNVGIGVSNPSFKFHVNGAVSVESLRISGTNLVSDLISSNNYSGQMANSVNAYVNTSTLSSNSYAGIMSNSSNSYAGSMANSSNRYAEYVGASGNAYVNLSSDSANSYAGAMANAVNAYTFATYLPFTGGTISGDITVQGNAVFSGKTTYANTETLLIGDNIFVLNADLPNNISPSEDAGILINRGSSDNVSIYWNEGQDLWLMTAPGQNDVKIASNIDISNAETRLTAAYDVANAAYGNSNSVAISANAYAGAMANSSNVYAEYVGASGNAYVNLSSDSANSYSGSMANSSNNYAGSMSNSSNAYAGSMANSSNGYTVSVGESGNDYTNLSTTSANAYAGAMANSSNSYGDYVGASGNNYTNLSVTSANAYSGDMANSANAYAGAMSNSSNNYAGSMANAVNSYTAVTYATSTNATAAFTKANNALSNTSGVTFNGNLNISGKSNVTGALITDDDITIRKSGAVLTLGNSAASVGVTKINMSWGTTGVPVTITAGPTTNYNGTTGLDILNTNGGSHLDLRSYAYPGFWGPTGQGVRLRIEGSNGDVQIFNTTQSTSTNTGALQVSGGVGIAGNLNVGGANSSFSGNVGIGTVPKNYRLDVAGSINASAIYVNGDQLAIGTIDLSPAYNWANGVGTNANSYTVTVGTSANAYAGAMANAANVYAGSMANAANSYVDNNYLNLNWGGELKSDLSIKNGSYLIFRTNPGNAFSSIATQMVMEYGNNFTIYYAGNSAAYFMPNGSFGIGYTIGNPDRFVVKSTGNVGIGTTDPSYKLDVTGVVNASAIYVNGADAIAAGNNYAGSMSNSSNLWANAVGTSGNSYAEAVGASGNLWSNAVGTAGNAYSEYIGASGNLWANAVGTAGNSYAEAVGASSNLWANAVGTAGNNYTIAVGAAANTWANTKIANTSGVTTAGDFNVSGILTTQNALRETRVAIAASNIDLGAGNYFTKTISGTTTFTVTNTASAGTVSSFILDLTNGGSATVNWWATIKWGSGLAPTLTSSGRDVIGFFTHDGGTTWTGIVMAKDAK